MPRDQIKPEIFKGSICLPRLVKDDHPRLMDHCPSCGSTILMTGAGSWD